MGLPIDSVLEMSSLCQIGGYMPSSHLGFSFLQVEQVSSIFKGGESLYFPLSDHVLTHFNTSRSKDRLRSKGVRLPELMRSSLKTQIFSK
jgi:hypothetical protein